jgi:hypothetical protein
MVLPWFHYAFSQPKPQATLAKSPWLLSSLALWSHRDVAVSAVAAAEPQTFQADLTSWAKITWKYEEMDGIETGYDILKYIKIY